MGITRASHGNRVLVVAKAVGGFVFNGFSGLLLLHARLKAAALNHETGDHTVKNRVVVKTVTNVLFEIFARGRSVFVGACS